MEIDLNGKFILKLCFFLLKKKLHNSLKTKFYWFFFYDKILIYVKLFSLKFTTLITMMTKVLTHLHF